MLPYQEFMTPPALSTRSSSVWPSRHSRMGMLWLAVLLVSGCATTKDLDALRVQLNDQMTTVRSEAAQSRQAVDALKTDVTLLKSLGVAVDSLKSRLDIALATLQSLQTESESHRTTLGNLRVDFKEYRAAHEAVARETDRLRMSVGSLEQGMLHQLQMEVTLARERIKQLEQVIESLQKSAPVEKGKEGPAPPKL